MLSGCGQKVHFSSLSSTDGTSGDGTKSRIRFKPISQDAFTDAIDNGTWSTSQVYSSEDKKTYYKAEYEIGYGEVMRPLSRAIPTLMRQACSAAGLPSKGDSYRRDELPCGEPINDSWKNLVNINMNQQWGNFNGYNYWIGGLHIPIQIGRTSNSGEFSENSLDNLQTIKKMSSAVMGDDIAIRFLPQGDKLDVDFCVNIPGTQVTAPYTYIPASVEQKLWFFSINLQADMEVHPGIVDYDYIRQCFKTQVGFNPTDGLPIATIMHIPPGHIANARLNYTSLKFVNFWTQIVDFVVSVFGTNIRNEIVKYAQGEVSSISQNDFNTGAWLTQITQGAIGEKYTREIGRDLNIDMANRNLPTSGAALRDALNAQCERLSALTSIEDLNRLGVQACREALNEVEISIEPFVFDPEMEKMGCYQYFANVHQANKNNPWWDKGCKFKVRLMAGLTPKAQGALELLQQLLTGLLDGTIDPFTLIGHLPEEVQQQLRMINFDLLDSIIAGLKAQGDTDISLEDLKAFFEQHPELLQQLFIQ